MTESESVALPLGDTPIFKLLRYFSKLCTFNQAFLYPFQNYLYFPDPVWLRIAARYRLCVIDTGILIYFSLFPQIKDSRKLYVFRGSFIAALSSAIVGLVDKNATSVTIGDRHFFNVLL